MKDNNKLSFEKAKGIPGIVYVPECSDCSKKNNCKDCFSCQFCSDERCDLCLKKKSNNKK